MAQRSLQVFDRWGEKIFDAQNLPINGNEGWDGTFKGEPMGTGVFVYDIEIEYIDDFVGSFRGDITLLR